MFEKLNGSGYMLDEVIKTLGLESQRYVIASDWDKSYRSYPEDIYFLKNDFIKSNNEYFGFPDELLELCKNTVKLISSNINLKLLAWHMNKILFEYKDEKITSELVLNWPNLEAAMGGLSDMFSVIIFASGINPLLKYYNEKGIPDTILKHTLDDLILWMNSHRRKTGRWGFSEYTWLIHHFQGKVFRLGRLQFQPIKFEDKIIVYRNKANNNLIVISKGNIKYRQDGQKDGTSGIFDRDNSWFSFYKKNGGKISGNVILKDGSCSKDIIEISEEEWSEVLNENDQVLNVHIQEGNKLDHDLCLESYNSALLFFRKYFPELNPKAFVCESWLLDSQLRNVLDSESNIVKFLNDFYTVPVYSPKEAQMYERVFGKYSDNLNDLPENTRLQRAIKQYLASGSLMRNGAGFILI